MESLEAVLARARAVLGVKTDKQMCEILDIPYATIGTWKDRKKIPKGKLLEIASKLNVTPEYLQTGVNISNNTNSVVVNGSNIGTINNGHHQTEVSKELMEFVEMYKKYGNTAMLKKWMKELKRIELITKEDDFTLEEVNAVINDKKLFEKNPDLAKKAMENLLKYFQEVKEYDLKTVDEIFKRVNDKTKA